MNAASPEGRRIEAQLRGRYTEVWTDIRRELAKHSELRRRNPAGAARSHATCDAMRELPVAYRACPGIIGPYAVALS